MQEIKKFSAKVKVTKQNKGNKILLTLTEAEGIYLEILSLQNEVKDLKEKISNTVPEIIYIAADPVIVDTNPTVLDSKDTLPKKEKIINVTGRPFRD